MYDMNPPSAFGSHFIVLVSHRLLRAWHRLMSNDAVTPRRDDSCATMRPLRGSARLLQEWFEPAGSPAPAQFVENCRRRPETTRLSGTPGRRQRFVKGAAFVVGQVITFVVGDQIDNRAFAWG
jgi:hypothetical protein